MLRFKNFLLDEDGVGVVEMVLIVVVLIALVMIFKTRLTTTVNDIFDKIKEESGKVLCKTWSIEDTVEALRFLQHFR